MSLSSLVGQQIKAGTVAEHASYVGQVAELTVVTDAAPPELRLHDGVTPGGWPVGSGGGGGSVNWGAIGGTLSSQTDLAAALVALRIPVGGIYISTTATNPATSLGYGTWSAIAAGRVLVGQDTGDTDFDVLGETGGSKTV